MKSSPLGDNKQVLPINITHNAHSVFPSRGIKLNTTLLQKQWHICHFKPHFLAVESHFSLIPPIPLGKQCYMSFCKFCRCNPTTLDYNGGQTANWGIVAWCSEFKELVKVLYEKSLSNTTSQLLSPIVEALQQSLVVQWDTHQDTSEKIGIHVNNRNFPSAQLFYSFVL